jgi:serine/threonine-protein kinase
VAKHRALPNAFDNPLGGQFVGTPCYMSPEQASSGTVDWRSDLWALAVITFECLTGELPFQDESVVDMIVSITRGTVPKITQNRPELPAELEFWWQRATARDPAHRFQSAKEFADALAAAIDVYPMTVSDFPQPDGEAPTVLDPLSIMPSSRRPALVAHAARSRPSPSPYSYETDAAVTMHAQFSSSVSQSKGALRKRRRLSPYVVAGTALCAAVALGAGAWRPTLDGVTGALGFDFASQAPPLPWAAEARQGAGLPQGDSLISARVPSSPETVMATALPPLTLLPEIPEPSVLVVAEPRAPLANSGPPAKRPNVAVRKPNHWRPLAPPAPAPSAPPVVPELRLERPEKDYGI